MAFVEIVVRAWICDMCGVEVLAADDNMPHGWVLSPDGDRHACPVCIPPGRWAWMDERRAS